MVTVFSLERPTEVLPIEEVELVSPQKRVLAVVLDSGNGARMNTLCSERPMPALPFAGRYRVIDFSLSNCVHSDINNIAVILDQRHGDMDAYLRRWQSANYLAYPTI